MDNSIIGEFSVLTPSQKKELEQKRKENKERADAEVARKAEEAKAAKRREEERLAAIRAENAARESKKNILRLGIAVLCILTIIVVWIWIHFFNVFCYDVDPKADIVAKIVFGLLYFMVTSLVAYPILWGIWLGVEKIRDKIKALN